MIQEFGTENLPDFLRMRMDRPDQLEEKFELIHAIDSALASDTTTQLPWPSVHVLKGHNHVLRQSGYYEFPIHASSFVEFNNNAFFMFRAFLFQHRSDVFHPTHNRS